MKKPPLCPDCQHFMHVPFTAGHCKRRLLDEAFPRITAEWEWPDNDIKRCGPDARYFVAKAKEVAA